MSGSVLWCNDGHMQARLRVPTTDPPRWTKSDRTSSQDILTRVKAEAVKVLYKAKLRLLVPKFRVLFFFPALFSITDQILSKS